MKLTRPAAALAFVLLLGWSAAGLTAEPIPAPDWRTLETDHFQWSYAPSMEGRTRELSGQAEKLRGEVMAAMGVSRLERVRVVMAPDAETFWSVQPGGAPRWASGTCYPEQRLIFLRPLDPLEMRAGTLIGVLAHELAHVVFHERLGGHQAPRWLDEGMAERFGLEQEMDFPGPLLWVGITGRAIPFAELERDFPENGSQAQTAYAQSSDFVAYLRRTYGERAFGGFLDRLAGGEDWPAAFAASFGPLAGVEKNWLRRVRWIYGVIGVVGGGSPLWFGVSLLGIWAWYRKKQRGRQRIELWELEDRKAALLASSDDEDQDDEGPPTYH